MIERKQCVVHDGVIINIGPWDEQIHSMPTGEYETVVIKPERTETDEEGNEVIIPEETIQVELYEDRPTNPMPEGATIEERDFEYDDVYGWREAGTPIPESDAQKVARLESELSVSKSDNLNTMDALFDVYLMVLDMQSGNGGTPA
ncbi:hypothetical protein PV433_31085 [Paenibacillus sp. GYB004]|uniref:hypothetical protein n=1 Tax=Paenibacillus sp. GYB004 TaxID=2994393 RepID=UPI002F96C9CA